MKLSSQARPQMSRWFPGSSRTRRSGRVKPSRARESALRSPPESFPTSTSAHASSPRLARKRRAFSSARSPSSASYSARSVSRIAQATSRDPFPGRRFMLFSRIANSSRMAVNGSTTKASAVPAKAGKLCGTKPTRTSPERATSLSSRVVTRGESARASSCRRRSGRSVRFSHSCRYAR